MIATFIVYLLLMLAIGVLASRRTRNAGDYFLGGRRLGPWVTAISAGASDMSGWLLLGLPGYAFASGVQAIWLVGGLWLGTYLNWRLVAERLRRYSQGAADAITLPAFLSERFGGHRGLRIGSAFFVLLFFLFYVSSGLVAGGKLFESVFSIPYGYAVTAGTLVIMLYTLMGGFLAVSWTDLIQGLLMALALVVVPLLALHQIGPSVAIERIRDIDPALLDPFANASGLAIVSLLAWGLGYFGQPHILARFMAARDTSTLQQARRIAMGWVSLGMLGAMAAGLAGIALLQPVASDFDAEKVFIELIATLLHPIPAGICLAAILAAIMSTADSQLLVASSALAEDLYGALGKGTLNERRRMSVARLTVLGIAATAWGLALEPDSGVLELVSYAWAGFGAAFGPVILLSLFWARMTARGALAGVIAGGVTVVLWKQLSGGWFEVYELLPGFILAFVAAIAISLIDREPAAEIRTRHQRMFG
ncbi:MAG: sodium/proline symporter PutP [Chromatiales bacterium]|nr:sodium/proline symporter PutP [Chromatiales bacterium]